MSNIYHYFSAPSDQEAATTIERVGSPASQEIFSEESGSLTVVKDELLPIFDTVEEAGIDPAVELGKLVEIITGRSLEDIWEDDRSSEPVAIENDGEQMVFTVSDSVTEALASVDASSIEGIAQEWSEIEEFSHWSEPKGLATLVGDLSALAKRALESGQRLYCWFSL